MRCEHFGGEAKNGAKYRPGLPERPARKKGSIRFRAALVLSAVMLVLVLTGCGKKDRFASPLEFYRYVENTAVGNAAERFGGAYDSALSEAVDPSGRRIDAGLELELFKPAADMLQTYTGMDFSWLKTLGFDAGVSFAEDNGAVELSLSLNGRELIGMEWFTDVAEQMIYGRVPLLSEEYFQASFDEMGLRMENLDALKQQESQLDVRALSDLLPRCAEAALECVEDVKQGSDTLEAGGVSAKYTTLTVTLTDENLRDMAKEVRSILKKDADLEDFILKLEEMSGGELYDDFLEALDELPGSVLPDEELVMTLYVDEDDTIRGRVVEYGDYIFRYAMPEDRGEFGLELSLEDTEDDEVLWSVSGDGERDDGALSGTFTFEMEETEFFTILVEDVDTEQTDKALRTGKVTVRPTYDYYTYFGIYSLTARALEEFSYTLRMEGNDAVFDVYMGDDPFLALTVRAKTGSAEPIPDVDRAQDINSWSMSLLLGGGLEKYLGYLAESDIPAELLEQLFGMAF